MNPFKSFPQENIHIEKPNGVIAGPYKATFTGSLIVIWNEKADIEECDKILRPLPSGKDECSYVTEATFYQKASSIPPHYQIKFTKSKIKSNSHSSDNSVTIQNAHSVQIGDNNTQNIINSFQALMTQIDSSSALPEEKEEAKSLLAKLIKHPLVVSILGAVASSVL